MVFGMEPWDLFRHWGKTWLFLDYFSKRYFVVGVLGIQPKAVGVRQVLHSTARAHLEQDLAPWEESWPVLDLYKREWFQSCREIESEAYLGQDPRTLLFSFSCPPCLPLPSSPLFPSETRSLDWPGTQRVYLLPSTEVRGVCYYTTRNLYSW